MTALVRSVCRSRRSEALRIGGMLRRGARVRAVLAGGATVFVVLCVSAGTASAGTKVFTTSGPHTWVAPNFYPPFVQVTVDAFGADGGGLLATPSRAGFAA